MAVAVHIHNYTFPRGVSDIPLCLPTNSTPDLSYMRTFGCQVYVHVPLANRPKIAPSAREGILIGCSSNSPAWLVWMPDAKPIFTIRVVAFDESYRMGRFDASLLDEWHASTHEGCGTY
jgi:hypothetical protein